MPRLRRAKVEVELRWVDGGVDDSKLRLRLSGVKSEARYFGSRMAFLS